ncbi:unnamed protein product, partial [Didymodactylos carnosus]
NTCTTESNENDCYVKDNDSGNDNGNIVTPWKVNRISRLGVDYDKVIAKFGSTRLSHDLIKKIETTIQQPVHYFIRRGIFFSH